MKNFQDDKNSLKEPKEIKDKIFEKVKKKLKKKMNYVEIDSETAKSVDVDFVEQISKKIRKDKKEKK